MNLHLLETNGCEGEDGDGDSVDRIFVSGSRKDLMDIIQSVSIGQEIDIYFNKYGKIDSIIPR